MNKPARLKLKWLLSIYLMLVAGLMVAGFLTGVSRGTWLLVLLVTLSGLSIILFTAVFYFRIREQLQEQTLELNQQLNEDMNRGFSQQESYLQLMHFIRPAFPLPHTRGWAASPDFMGLVFKYILLNKPAVIMELGSGTSTLYIGHLLKAQQLKASLLSVDHDPVYAGMTRENIRLAGLGELVRMEDCPIGTVQIRGTDWHWYSLANISVPGLDMLIVDGPIGSLQRKARYPALPLLYEKLNPGATIFLDDYNRPEEQELVADWLREFPGLSLIREMPAEKGAAVLRKGS